MWRGLSEFLCEVIWISAVNCGHYWEPFSIGLRLQWRQSVPAMKHLAIPKWLAQLGLPEYSVLFDDEYDGVEDLLHLTELDLQELGVHNRVHRVHILSSIQLLQERERRRGHEFVFYSHYVRDSAVLLSSSEIKTGKNLESLRDVWICKIELKMMAEGKFASLPRNMHMGRQCSLASSMDLLSSRPAVAPLPPSGYQSVSIHGTLPRRKKDGGSGHLWGTNGHTGSLPLPGRARLPSSPLIHNIIGGTPCFRL
ncbi:hypothetical protein GJAV_G00079810 [Gymnothorax javanicus]|nr:hypothetical protein GJAV_G00079810 [Gymnothorax javanicus]